MRHRAFFALRISLLFCFLLDASNLDAQRRPKPEPEISPDSLRLLLSAKGKEATLHGLYYRHVIEQLNAIESEYVKLGYDQNRVSQVIDSVIKANPKEADAILVDLSLGKRMDVKPITKPTGKFDGYLSPNAERQILNLQWDTKNKPFLRNLKEGKFPDLDRDMEQILINEANQNKLVEEYMRSAILERVRQHIGKKLIFALDANDPLSAKIGDSVESYLLSNLRAVLAEKNVSELTQMMSVVDKFFD
ncbi:MAG: hypothetical protein NZM06_01895 [Chloroherpetonaceae bacterium]|nr:hypothetical protein [Chloroherpetonaceae bacterium]MDW8437183.1 hypothetical protein [Chloroherpetonaceae bacterium]